MPLDVPVLLYAINLKHSSNSINKFCRYIYMSVCRKRKIGNEFKEKQTNKHNK